MRKCISIYVLKPTMSSGSIGRRSAGWLRGQCFRRQRTGRHNNGYRRGISRKRGRADGSGL